MPLSSPAHSFHGAERGISLSYSDFTAEPRTQYTCLLQVGSRDWEPDGGGRGKARRGQN